MNVLKASQLLIYLIIAYIGIGMTVYGQENDFKTKEIEFEYVEEQPEPYSNSDLTNEITHVAILQFRSDRNFNIDSWPTAILSTEAGKSMSVKQKSLVAGFLKSPNPHLFFGPRSLMNGVTSFRLIAVSDKDVRKMVEALYEYFNNRAQDQMKAAKEQLEQTRLMLADAEQKLKGLMTNADATTTTFNEKVKEYAKDKYIIDTNTPGILTHIKEILPELQKQLSKVRVELTGVQARIKAIDKLRNGGKITNPDTLVMLQQMQITAEVDLASVLARRNMLETVSEQTQELFKIGMREREMSQEVGRLEAILLDKHDVVLTLEQQLGDPPSVWKPVTIPRNRVVIHEIPRARTQKP